MTQKEERNRISKISGIVGIGVNVLLCTMKLITGRVVNSISILSDGFNNLSDVFNALMVFVGYRLTGKPADRKHPYGHGRFEYMMSQFISLMVMYVGISLLRSSIQRLIAPKKVLMNRYALIILGVSILVKTGLAFWYGKMYEKSNLAPLQAQKADSLADVAGTAVILAGYVLGFFTSLPVDSIIGIVVSVIIVLSGFRIFYQMTSILLGQPADEELFVKIEEELKQERQIKGYHDLRLHS
ncbi:MAG: cation transporter, partial [Erysipelotrichaceae bacterium]|nr:cation transporter [Erysipelotrichaceae bacterium]